MSTSKGAATSRSPLEEAVIKLIEQLTTSGKDDLDRKALKALFEHAAVSEGNLRLCADLLFKQMALDHAQIRYASLLVLAELVKRSSFFRDEILFREDNHLATLTKLTVQCDTKVPKRGKAKPLRPQSIASKLKSKSLELLVHWKEEYAQNKRSALSRTLKRIFTVLEMPLPNSATSEPSPVPAQIAASALDIVQREFEANEAEMLSTVEEMKSSFDLLFPRCDSEADEAAIAASDEAIPESASDDEAEFDSDEALQRHEYLPIRVLAPNGLINVRRSDDNEAILDNLMGLHKLITNRFLPRLETWLSADFEDNHVLEDRMDEMRKKLLHEKSRFERLNVKAKNEPETSESEEDDSDFEEIGTVPEWMEIPCLNFTPNPEEQASASNTQAHANTSQSSISETACRAPLADGKLCPRKDLLKCPFHGRIIRRDDKGNAVEDCEREYEAQRLEGARMRESDWQDTKHLKNLQSKIGMDLTLRKGRRGKQTFEERFPGLISLKSVKSSKKRLTRKMSHTNARKRQKTNISIDEAPVPY